MPFSRKQVGDLVRLDAVLEAGDLVAKLLGDIDHDRHFVGAIAVVVDQDLAVEHASKRVHRQVLRRNLAAGLFIFGPLAVIFLGLGPGLPDIGDVAHAGLRHLVLGSVDALGIFAAGHFEAIGRAREFHSLHGARRHVLQHDRPAAEQVRRAGQDLKRRDAAIGQRTREAGVLRPDAMFGPDFRPRRRGRLVAVAESTARRAMDSRRDGCARR